MYDPFCEYCAAEDNIIECPMCSTMFCENHSLDTPETFTMTDYVCPHCGCEVIDEG